MIKHHTIAAGFLLIDDYKTDNALASAKGRIGEDIWKRGYTERSCIEVRKALKEAGAPFQTKITGVLKSISCTQTSDGSNTYQKVRVEVQIAEDKTVILSLEPGLEFTQRLLAKLEVVEAGQTLTIGAFVELVSRGGGRTFVNHLATVKSQSGDEIKALREHFAEAAKASAAAEQAMAPLGMDEKTIKSAKMAAKTNYFWKLAQAIATKFEPVTSA